MNVFPVSYSTLSAKALQAFISGQYGFLNLSCKYFLRGVSDTYILKTDSEKYILKIYRDAHRSLEEIKGEVELLSILEEKGIHIAPVLKDLSGNTIQAFNAPEGLRYGIVIAFAKGKADNNLTDSQVAILGREMAAMHNVTSTIKLSHPRKPFTPETLVHRPLRVLKAMFEEYNMMEDFEYLQAASEKMLNKLSELNCDTFSTGYCHYDFFPKNFFFDEADNITIFDFDFAGEGWLANDLASFHVHLYFHITHGFISREEGDRIFGKLIKHYRSIRPFTENESAAIPQLGYLLLLFYLCFQYENFDDWSNLVFGPKFVKSRIAGMKEYEAFFC